MLLRLRRSIQRRGLQLDANGCYGSGDYSATICVSDGALDDCETITITVTDGEAPYVLSGVSHGVDPYTDVTMVGTSFTVRKGM
jgi:hypothetical protein